MSAPDREHDAVLRFDYDDERTARIVADAVGVETAGIAAVDDRSRTTVDREGETLTLDVEAVDLTALRAACATWTRLVETAERVATRG